MGYIDYLKENKDYIPQEELNNWVCFGYGQEEDLRFFVDRLNWNIVLKTRKLSESFIREHIEYLDLKTVFLTQNVSKDFKCEFHIEKYIDDWKEYEDLEDSRVARQVLGQIMHIGVMLVK